MNFFTISSTLVLSVISLPLAGVSHHLWKSSIHLEDSKFNNNEVKFIRYIVHKIQSFQGIITGWYLANSDLVVLDEVCKHIGVV
ncbi:MAG TPA: hypothetical protein VFJ51_15050 [Nitrososphaeraceae archaeon]|nr:hypothetical protein [Nitrososphaeraceae archaeon]